MIDRKEHWEQVYSSKLATEVSWYAQHLELSTAMIRAVAPVGSSIIDVGGGSSTLVDDLLDLGYSNVSVLDVSSHALAGARQRLGVRADEVQWIEGDVTSVQLPPEAYDVWHDRAAFHFLTSPLDRRAYVDLATGSLRPGGQAILAAFSLEGPSRCSGLEIVQYSAESLGRELGPSFVLKEEVHDSHRTPSGSEQRMIYCRFEKHLDPPPGK